MKKCSKCKILKNQSCFGKDKQKKDGLASQCNKCRSSYAKRKWKKNKKSLKERLKHLRENEVSPTQRVCRECKIDLPIDNFHKNRSYPGGHIYVCKTCRLSALADRYQNDESFRNKRKDFEKKARLDNPEKYKEKRSRAYKLNKEAYLVRNSKRRAQKLNLEEQLSRTFRRFIKLKFDNKCFNCESTKRLSLDHHRPLSKGYVLNENNCVLLCQSCNSRKHNKDPEDFYTKDQLKILKEVYFVGENYEH